MQTVHSNKHTLLVEATGFIKTQLNHTHQFDVLSSNNRVCLEKVVESQNTLDHTFHISSANL